MADVASAAQPAVNCLDQISARVWTVRRYVAAAIVLLFAIGVNPSWLPAPDSALYLMLGRSLASGEGYTLFGKPHAYVPPGFPLFLAGMERIGLGSMFCLNLTMALIGLAAVWFCYKLICQIASKEIACVVTALLGCSSLLHVMSAMQLSDMPFTLLAIAGLYEMRRGLQGARWSLELGSLMIVASCWVRAAGLALAVAAALGLLLQRGSTSGWRISLNSLGLLAGVAATLSIFVAQHQRMTCVEGSLPPASYLAGIAPLFEHPSLALVLKPIKNAAESLSETGRLLSGGDVSPIIVLICILCPLLLGFYRQVRQRELLLPVAVVGYLAGVLVILPAEGRYLLPVAPPLILSYLQGLSAILDRFPRLVRWAPRIMLGCVGLLVALNGMRSCYVSLYKNYHYWADRRVELVHTAECLQSAAAGGEHFLSADSERQLAYLSGVPLVQLDRGALLRVVGDDGYMRFMFEQGVRLVVAAVDTTSALPDAQVIRRAVEDRRAFDLVANDGHFCIYRFRARPAVAEAALPSAGEIR